MKFLKIFFIATLTFSVLFSCKNEVKKEKETQTTVSNAKNISLSISGMTCEIGCAKTIQSKLSKKEGIIDAKVIFKDSLATIAYDADKISKHEIIRFIDGIATGDLYKASEHKKACASKCIKACCDSKKSKKECKKDSTKTHCTSKGLKKECKKDSIKTHCTSKDAKKECKKDSIKACCASKKINAKCKKECAKACCTSKKTE